jgi:Phosphoenolpyruvate-protein kinase (PTS system EI component in bacteria)
MLLDQPDLLKLQLEAILIASASEPGRVSVMIPMVTFLEEIDRVRAVMNSVMDDLNARGVSFDRNIPFGVMMEVPALVLQAKAVAERVDFMSIGTNDLIQYTLAADRGNERVAAHFEPRHPAVWKLVSLLRDASLQTGCSLRVCGEMASEPAYAAAFLGFGVRELSMGVQDVPAVGSHLAEVSIVEAESLAHSLVVADCMKEVHGVFEAWKKNYLL